MDRDMGESLITTLSMDNHHPSTLLSIDTIGTPTSYDDCDREMTIQCQQILLPRPPPDINLPLIAEHSSRPPLWNLSETCDILDASLGPQIYETETLLNFPKAVSRKYAKRGDSIWGAWFFFNFYFKPVLLEKSKGKVVRDANGLSGFDKSDLQLDVFLVQHDMENMYMWVFKERPENALGKMQLRSYMNGHSRLGEPHFPFSVGKGFGRSHRMQRKHYKGLSNPQCVHGVEIVRSPNLLGVPEADRKRWMELTGRDLSFSIPLDASDFGSWRNVPHSEFEIEKHSHPRNLLSNGPCLNLATQAVSHANGSNIDFSLNAKHHKKSSSPNRMDEDHCSPMNTSNDTAKDVEMHHAGPSWSNDFSGVMKYACGPVTAAKTIYEDEEAYLIVVSLPFSDLQRVKVSWRNTLTHGIVKILGFSTSCTPLLKRNNRTFKLTDLSPEHCPSGEFVREISLATRIPDDAKLEAYCDMSGSILEIMVPKHRTGPEEHEVHVCLHSQRVASEFLLA